MIHSGNIFKENIPKKLNYKILFFTIEINIFSKTKVKHKVTSKMNDQSSNY